MCADVVIFNVGHLLIVHVVPFPLQVYANGQLPDSLCEIYPFLCITKSKSATQSID